ncbi:MAG: AI-2E family transporter [Eubacteriales bacterium]|nr:AI-2E family transporter [Eubacteriales bacterium]
MREKKDLIRYGALCVAALLLLYHYWDSAMSGVGALLGAAQPLLTGCAMAYIVNLIMVFYENTLLKRWRGKASGRRAASITLSLVTLFLILSLILNMILPELRSCMEVLLSSIPTAYGQVMDFLARYPELMELLPGGANSRIDIQQVLDQLFKLVGSGAGASLVNYISSLLTVVFDLIMALFFAVYLLAGKEWLARQTGRLLKTYVSPGITDRLYYVLRTLDSCFHRFIVGQCTEAVILGTLCALGMILFRFPYAVMIGVLVGATALIPIFGAYIGGAVGFIMIFTVSPVQALLFVAFIVVLQQLEGQLIYPRVVGSSIGLPGVFVFAAVLLGGSLFGVLGVLLGIPLTASAYQLLKDDLARRTPL